MTKECPVTMVSVIMPAYNVEKYIKKALDSVCKQSYSDLEIMVIDDGSTDRTYEVLTEYAQNDSRIKVIKKKNGGVSSARNLALDNAHGEYICFFDSDDYLEENAIETFIRAIEDSSSDWVSAQYSRWSEDGSRLEDYDFIEGDRPFLTDDDRMNFLIKELLPYHVGFEVWGKLYKTAIIRDNDINFSEKCRIGEDLAFNIKYLMHSNKLKCISDRCIRYNIRSDSAMGGLNNLSRIIGENINLLEDIWEYAASIKKEWFIDRFPVICARVLDNSYIGHTPIEVSEAYKRIQDISFIADRYSGFENAKREIIAAYPEEISKIKYRYHILVYSYIKGFSVFERINLFIYDSYRKIKGRPILEKWKMPY